MQGEKSKRSARGDNKNECTVQWCTMSDSFIKDNSEKRNNRQPDIVHNAIVDNMRRFRGD